VAPLYDLPNWLLGVLVVGTTLGAALTGYVLSARLRRSLTDEQRSLSLIMLPIIATVHALLLAFSAVSVWEAFAAAETSVMNEANTVAQLAADLAVFDSAESHEARELLKTYVRTVVDEEWARLREGQDSPVAAERFDDLFRAVSRLEPDTPRRVAHAPEIWWRMNELVMHRRDRIHASEAAVPGALWAVVLLGAVLTLLPVYTLKSSRFNLAMIALLGCSIGLVFFFVVAMEHPFLGDEGLDAAPFSNALSQIERWDSKK
jgi:hypothetical protein